MSSRKFCRPNKSQQTSPIKTFSTISSEPPDDLWHHHLGHPSSKEFGFIDDPPIHMNTSELNKTPYLVCPLAKMHRKSFDHNDDRASHPFEILHYDL